MRRALVTGAASGLAAGIAPALAREGFELVAITYRNTEPAATLEAIRASGCEARAHHVDFSADAASVRGKLSQAMQDGPYDTLVHAVGPMVVKRFARMTLEDYREMFDGNVRSAVLAAQAVLPPMRESKFGRIVYFGMNGSSVTRAYRGFTLHQAAKSAVVAFAKCLSLEEAQFGITVNVIEPGDIRQKTISRAQALEMPAGNPRGRPGSYEDIADVVRFLVARERDFVTGAVLSVSGGLSEAAERNASPS